MSEDSQEKVNFERIWKILKGLDAAIGVFAFKDSAQRTILENLLKLTVPRHVFLWSFLVVSTLILTDFQLISVILTGSTSTVMLACYTVIIISKKTTFKKVIKWCEKLYDVEEKYHKVVQKSAETHLISIETRVTKILKWLRIVLYIDAVGFTFGFAIIGYFLPDIIYPKFSLPVPFYMPFEKQDTWLTFMTTVVVQTIVAVDTATMAIYLWGVGLCGLIHILGYLELVQEMADQITLDNNSISFEEWIRILNQMISDVNSVISWFGTLYALPYFFVEIATLGALFICGLIFTVVRQQYFFAVGITVVCALFFVACYANEKILEKLGNINETLYDTRWYELKSKQRKMLLILMNCDKIQRGFTAVGLHDLTLERFGIVVKAGYTNLLVLKDLVQK